MADCDPTSLTAEYLRSILNYDPVAGALVWRERADVPKHVNSRLVGTAAGHRQTKSDNAHLRVGVGGHRILAHRIIWCMMTGAFPDGFIDHINGDGTDNRWCNIRAATSQQNSANRKPYASRAMVKGVSLRRGAIKKPFNAQIRVSGRTINLGCYPTMEEAEAVYAAAAHKHFGDYARTTDGPMVDTSGKVGIVIEAGEVAS